MVNDFWFVPLENSRDNWKFWKGSPVFLTGTFRMEIRLPFTNFLSFVPFHVVTRIQSSAARQSGNFRQMVNDTYRSYRPKIPNQNFRNIFINGKQPLQLRLWNFNICIEKVDAKCWLVKTLGTCFHVFFNVCLHSRSFPLRADWQKSDSSVDVKP